MLNDINEQGMIFDAQQNMLGYVRENGFVYDDNRTMLGYVTQQGIVRDGSLRIVGQVTVRDTFPFSAGKAAFFLLKKTAWEENKIALSCT